MRLAKIVSFGLVGLILGLAWSRSVSSGYFQAWEKLPSPPSAVVEFVTVGEGNIIAKMTDGSLLRCSNWRHECWVHDEITEYSFDSTRVTKPCDSSSSEFASFTSSPASIIDCIQGVTQYAEGVGRYTYVLDSNGNVWEWSHMFAGDITLYAMFAPFCFPVLGILVGMIVFPKKRENTVV